MDTLEVLTLLLGACESRKVRVKVRKLKYPKPLAKSARLVYNQIRKPKDIGVSNGCTIGNL